MVKALSFVVVAILPALYSLSYAQTFSFGTYGDMPYGPEQLTQFPSLVRSLDAADISFVIHVGDIKSAGAPCTEALLRERIADIDGIRHPVVYLPGDNEWTDCWYQTQSMPIEWLSLLREIAYPSYGRSLGSPTMLTDFQAATNNMLIYPEHQSWSRAGVHFTSVHFVGSDNGLNDFPNRSPEHDEEVYQRIDAAIAWLNQSFDEAIENDAPAIVVATHANPFPESLELNPDYETQPFSAFQEALAQRALEFGKPVLLLHGDTHTFRFDRPLTIPGSGDLVENLYRLEVFGAPALGWVEVEVDTASTGVFSVRPKLLPGH
jgi:hypothetical protein